MLSIFHCDFYIPVYLFYNFGWVLFIPSCDLDFPVYFFYNSIYMLFVHNLIFFTTLGGCCLVLFAIGTSLFIFLHPCKTVVSSWL